MNGADISWLDLIIGSSVILGPLALFWYFRTGLVASASIAFLRMAGQLFLVGLYLRFVFDYNQLWLNALWIVIMIIAASFTIIGRGEINLKTFFPPMLLAVTASYVINGAIIAFLLVKIENFVDARYMIPLSGMIIGNSITNAVIGSRSFYKSLKENEDRYNYFLACGASRAEALYIFMKKALQEAFSPTVASTATIGMIWLPGMMTGQILGGTSPMQAIKYQILIVIAIFVAGVITVFLSLSVSKGFVFDEYDVFIKEKTFKKTKVGKKIRKVTKK